MRFPLEFKGNLNVCACVFAYVHVNVHVHACAFVCVHMCVIFGILPVKGAASNLPPIQREDWRWQSGCASVSWSLGIRRGEQRGRRTVWIRREGGCREQPLQRDNPPARRAVWSYFVFQPPFHLSFAQSLELIIFTNHFPFALFIPIQLLSDWKIKWPLNIFFSLYC